MQDCESDSDGVGTGDERVRADLNPWRAAGWYFRHGDCIEIERHSEDAPTRVLAD